MKLHKCCDKNELRPVLSHIYIDSENIVASNAHILIVIPKSHIFGDQEIPEMYVHWRQWAQIYPSENRTIKYKEGHLICYREYKDGRIIEIARIKPTLSKDFNGTYPNYKAILPKPEDEPIPVSKIGIKPKFMGLINEGLMWEYPNDVKMEFYGEVNSIIITPTNEDLKGRKALLMPVIRI